GASSATVRSASNPSPLRLSSDPGRKSSTPYPLASGSDFSRPRYSSGVTVTSYGKTHGRVGWTGAILALLAIGTLVGVVVVRALSEDRQGSNAANGSGILVPPVTAVPSPHPPDLTPIEVDPAERTPA